MKKVEIEILNYITGTFTMSAGAQLAINPNFTTPLGSIQQGVNSSGTLAYPMPMQAAIEFNHPTNTQWRGWYSGYSPTFITHDGAPPYLSGAILVLPTIQNAASTYYNFSGVYQMITGLTAGATYTIEVDIAYMPTTNLSQHKLLINVMGANPITLMPIGTGYAYSLNDSTHAINTLSLGINTFSITPSSWQLGGGTEGILAITHGSSHPEEIRINSVKMFTTTSTQVIGLDAERSVVGKLDLTDSKNFPLAMTFSVAEGKDIESIFGDYSKTFQVPATKNNQKLLGHIHNALVIDEKEVIAYKDCRISVDGISFLSGKLKITGASQKKKVDFYNCVFFGGNADWGSQIKDKRLCDITFELGDGFSPYPPEIVYVYSAIQSTFGQTSATADIVYPLVSYGDFWPDGECGKVNLYDDQSESQDWRAWFYVYNILTYIFKATGYTISSNFMQVQHNSWFKQLITKLSWKLNDADQISEAYSLRYRGLLEYISGTTTTAQLQNFQLINNHSPTSGAISGYEPSGTPPCANCDGIQWDIRESDQYTQYDQDSYAGVATGKITIQKEGMARVSFGSAFSAFFNSPNYLYDVRSDIRIIYFNSALSTTTTVASATSGTYQFGSMGSGQQVWWNDEVVDIWRYVNVGDEFWGECQMRGTAPPAGTNNSATWDGWVYNEMSGFDSYIEMEFDAKDIHIGSRFDLNQLAPCGITQTDFIKSIAHMFNLYFYTDVQQKLVFIEPFNDFYSLTNATDWTNKIDYSKSITDKYEVGLSQEILFKYKKDSNDKYFAYLQRQVKAKNGYFEYYELLGQKFNAGMNVYENPIFSAMMEDYDKDVGGSGTFDGVRIPVLSGEIVNFGKLPQPCPFRGDKEEFDPKIAWYDGNTANGSAGNERWLNMTSAATTNTSQTYPRCVFVDRVQTGGNFEDRINLAYSDEYHDSGSVLAGLYHNYWKNMIEQLKLNPRIRTMHIKLSINDIMNLDLKKLVYLDGTYWRVSRIVDYSPAKTETTKVELIQWFEVGNFLPSVIPLNI